MDEGRDHRRAARAPGLRERLERERRRRNMEARARKLRAIAERCAALMGPGPSAVEHGDLLYDDAVTCCMTIGACPGDRRRLRAACSPEPRT